MAENRYFDYLCAIVGRSQEFSILLDELHKIEYYSLIPNDDNRGADGIYIRNIFLEEVGQTGHISLPDGPCTVLEMLIGLSYRLEFETAQSKWEKTVSEWFWILIDNLGLIKCHNDEYFTNCEVENTIPDIIGKMLAREYSHNGHGGLFPLKNPKKDQRKVEIWYQMTEYINENYPIYF